MKDRKISRENKKRAVEKIEAKRTREDILNDLHNGESLDRLTCGNILDLTPFLAQENIRRESR